MSVRKDRVKVFVEFHGVFNKCFDAFKEVFNVDGDNEDGFIVGEVVVFMTDGIVDNRVISLDEIDVVKGEDTEFVFEIFHTFSEFFELGDVLFLSLVKDVVIDVDSFVVVDAKTFFNFLRVVNHVVVFDFFEFIIEEYIFFGGRVVVLFAVSDFNGGGYDVDVFSEDGEF